MTNKELIEMLNRFINKAWCTYSEQTAREILRDVSPYIPKEYLIPIQAEWGHVQMGHGIEQARRALKDEVNNFISTIKI